MNYFPYNNYLIKDTIRLYNEIAYMENHINHFYLSVPKNRKKKKNKKLRHKKGK